MNKPKYFELIFILKESSSSNILAVIKYCHWVRKGSLERHFATVREK